MRRYRHPIGWGRAFVIGLGYGLVVAVIAAAAWTLFAGRPPALDSLIVIPFIVGIAIPLTLEAVERDWRDLKCSAPQRRT